MMGYTTKIKYAIKSGDRYATEKDGYSPNIREAKTYTYKPDFYCLVEKE